MHCSSFLLFSFYEYFQFNIGQFFNTRADGGMELSIRKYFEVICCQQVAVSSY